MEGANPHSQSLAGRLNDENITCTIADPNTDDPIRAILYHTFYAQHLPLNLAGGRREVHFMEASNLKDISDSTIY